MKNEYFGDNGNRLSFFSTKEELLKCAEEKATVNKNNKVKSLTQKEIQKIMHELHVHQAELEMQNEELRWAQTELEKSRERYFDLYELAPIGYFTMSEKGIITEANLTLSIMLGKLRSRLLNHPFASIVHPEDRVAFYNNLKKFFETSSPDIWIYRVIKGGRVPLWIRIDVTKEFDVSGAPFCRGVMINITEMKIFEQDLRKKIDELQAIINLHLIKDN